MKKILYWLLNINHSILLHHKCISSNVYKICVTFFLLNYPFSFFRYMAQLHVKRNIVRGGKWSIILRWLPLRQHNSGVDRSQLSGFSHNFVPALPYGPVLTVYFIRTTENTLYAIREALDHATTQRLRPQQHRCAYSRYYM